MENQMTTQVQLEFGPPKSEHQTVEKMVIYDDAGTNLQVTIDALEARIIALENA